jgi:hypothetical protein
MKFPQEIEVALKSAEHWGVRIEIIRSVRDDFEVKGWSGSKLASLTSSQIVTAPEYYKAVNPDGLIADTVIKVARTLVADSKKRNPDGYGTMTHSEAIEGMRSRDMQITGWQKSFEEQKAKAGDLAQELKKYKGAVAQLAFELEMATMGRAVVKVEAVRKAALEQAAEYLMDHGVVTTGNALVEVCEQIKKLHPVNATPPVQSPPQGAAA